MSAPDRGSERGSSDLLVGVLAGSTLLPFIQALATKAGEDAYAKIRKKLSRRDRKRARAEIREAGTISLTARDTRVILQVPATTSAELITRLETVRLPVQRDDWLRIVWNPGTSQWLVEDYHGPPPDNTSSR